VVPRLRDLWTEADEAMREDIAVLWTMPAIWAAGGRDELRLLVAAGTGQGAISGAGAIVRVHADPSDPELVRSASALLARTIESGAHRARLHAMAVAPLDADIVAALRKAAADEDGPIKVAALSRLLGSSPDRAQARRDLESIGGQKDSPVASRARFALATAGDVHIQAWIEDDLASPDPLTRLSAADALAALGRAARGAPLLADADPSVRTRAACTLLVAASRRPR
jgi:hypothetical protein